MALALGMLFATAAWAMAATRSAEPPDDGAAVDERDAPRAAPLGGPRHRAPPPPDRRAQGDGPDVEPGEPPRRRGGFRRPGPRGFREEGDGPPDRDADRPGPRHPGPPEDPQVIFRRVMEVLEAELPEWHERLEGMCEENPRRCRRVIRKLWPMIREYLAVKERDPELARTLIEEFKIEHELRERAKAYKKAKEDAEERKRLEAEITDLVRRQLEIRLRHRAARLEDLERRLEQEREKYEREREQIGVKVAKRVNQIKRGVFRGFGRGHKRAPGRFEDGPRRRFRRGEGEHARPPRRDRPPPGPDDDP